MEINNNIRLYIFATIFWLGFCILITGLMQESNRIAVNLWYCLPVISLLLIVDYLVFWKLDAPLPIYYTAHGLLFFITAPIFFAIFFAIFNPTHRYTFEKVENCRITGQMTANLLGAENYSILYVDLKYQDKDLLGYACLSDQSDEYAVSYLTSFSFYEMNSSYTCGPITKGDSYKISSRRVLSNSRSRLLRIRSSSRRRSYYSSSSSTKSCKTTYTFSAVKLASWMCSPKEEDINFDNQDCYVTLYNDDEQAIAQSQQRKPLRQADSFAMIVFNPDIYYPKGGLICLIIFCYLPMLQAFHPLFALVISCIAESCRNKPNFEIKPEQNQNQQYQDQQNLERQAEAEIKAGQNMIQLSQNQPIIQPTVIGYPQIIQPEGYNNNVQNAHAFLVPESNIIYGQNIGGQQMHNNQINNQQIQTVYLSGLPVPEQQGYQVIEPAKPINQSIHHSDHPLL